MGVTAAIVLMGLLSFVVADYGLCSQIYIMHQYCTSQLNPTSTAMSQRPVRQPRTGKAGPRGPRGIVNYTAIDEKLAGKFSEWEAIMEEKFLTFKSSADKEVKEMKLGVENMTKEFEASMRENCTRWKNSTESEIQEIKANLSNKENEFKSLVTHLFPASCEETGRFNGVVNIQRGWKVYEVYCDMTTDGGNWMVFQRRVDGSVDFYRNWEEYASGFGNKNGEFWLGLETIHQLTQDGEYELRVDLIDWDGSTAYAKYRTFSLSGRSDDYRLTVRGYSGTAGNSMGPHSGRRFSAKDKDLDSSPGNCATWIHAAWWFHYCGHSSLNGRYNDTSGSEFGVLWYHWGNRNYYSLKSSEMKFRKK